MQEVENTVKSRPPKSNHANRRKETKEERRCKGTLVFVLFLQFISRKYLTKKVCLAGKWRPTNYRLYISIPITSRVPYHPAPFPPLSLKVKLHNNSKNNKD
jgi:hypothetical protein